MPTTYTPKTEYFSSTRMQAQAKKLIADCKEDRQRALEAFSYYKAMVDSNPEDDKSKSEMMSALNLSQRSNDKVLKILELMAKYTLNSSKSEQEPETLSFENLRHVS
tara:strand:- start:1400 stop:1720 length:321 start_codon:yes stop_codon:yes gene_type:complete